MYFSTAVMQTHYKRGMDDIPEYSSAFAGSVLHGSKPADYTAGTSEADPDWVPIPAGSIEMVVENLTDPGILLTRDSDNAIDCTPLTLLSEVGQYYYRPLTEKESAFAERYADKFWHFKSWSLLPRKAFSRLLPGLKIDLQSRLPSLVEIFSWIWTKRLQKKIVKESNRYAVEKDPTAGQLLDGPLWKRRITMRDFRKFCGICAFMAVHCQPTVRDFWNVQSEALYCEEVASTISRNRFQFILSSLNVVMKSSIVKDRADSLYDPIGHVRWMLDDLVRNFNFAWNASCYLCVDECMVSYNGQYCNFK
jgi:hypothetical protein